MEKNDGFQIRSAFFGGKFLFQDLIEEILPVFAEKKEFE